MIAKLTITGFTIVVAILLLGAPLSTYAEPAQKIPRIGLIRPGSPPDPLVDAFVQGLRDLGYVEGQTMVIEYRWAEGRTTRLSDLSAELVRLKVDVIVTTGTPGALAARQTTSTIPIVVPVMIDPVGAGVVASLARPGGNITGLSLMSPEIGVKRMELLKETFPGVSRVAVLRDPRVSRMDLPPTEAAARTLGVHLQILEVRDINDLETTLAAARRERAGALNILTSAFFYAHRARILEAVAKIRLPAIYPQREYVAAGGLMVYGPLVSDLFRRAAVYVDKIVKGTKPRDLPIEQPTRFEFVINMKTVKALGLTIPQSILVRADQVIE
jgi:putative ABC transport system substrate-binding protein